MNLFMELSDLFSQILIFSIKGFKAINRFFSRIFNMKKLTLQHPYFFLCMFQINLKKYNNICWKLKI